MQREAHVSQGEVEGSQGSGIEHRARRRGGERRLGVAALTTLRHQADSLTEVELAHLAAVAARAGKYLRAGDWQEAQTGSSIVKRMRMQGHVGLRLLAAYVTSNICWGH